MSMKPLEALDAPYFQQRAARNRRRGDEVRHKTRLRRYWRALGYDELAERDRVPDPRECSCFLCRGRHIERARRRETLAPQIDAG